MTQARAALKIIEIESLDELTLVNTVQLLQQVKVILSDKMLIKLQKTESNWNKKRIIRRNTTVKC